MDWFDPVGLDGTHVRLEAPSPAHVDDLWTASQDEDVWRWMPVYRPQTVDGMRAVVEGSLAERKRGRLVPWAIVDRSTGRAVGSTSYLDVVPEHLRVEIGWTWIGRPGGALRSIPKSSCSCSVAPLTTSAPAASR